VRRRLGVSRWTGMSGGAHEPVLGDVGPKHAATASLALLGAAVDDELARAALGMAHGEGGVQTLRKGDVARLWIVGRIRLEPRERAHVGDHRFAPVALWPQHSNLARIASKSVSRSFAIPISVLTPWPFRGRVCMRPPPVHPPAVRFVVGPEGAPQGRLLVEHDEEMHEQEKAAGIDQQASASVVERGPHEGEPCAEIHRIADPSVGTARDQASRRIERRRGASSDDHEGEDAPDGERRSRGGDDHAGDLKDSERFRTRDARCGEDATRNETSRRPQKSVAYVRARASTAMVVVTASTHPPTAARVPLRFRDAAGRC